MASNVLQQLRCSWRNMAKCTGVISRVLHCFCAGVILCQTAPVVLLQLRTWMLSAGQVGACSTELVLALGS